MSKPMRTVAVTLPLLILAAVVAWAAFALSRGPAVINAASTTSAGGTREANIVIQTVPALGYGDHPDWVSYLIQDPNGTWHHTTNFTVPANALVHVTLYQYDSGSNLRNPVLNQVLGTVGNQEMLNGKPIQTWTKNIGHTFTVPELGVSVFLPAVPDDAKNPCPGAPCETKYDHNTITFSFHTGAPGNYRWQCFVPCGSAFLYGFGGPMNTYGYMGGFVKVVA